MRTQTSGLCLLLSLLFVWWALTPHGVHLEFPQPAATFAPYGEPMTAPTEPAPKPVEPGEETAAEVARADRDYWTDRDWPTEPDDPSDHYYC